MRARLNSTPNLEHFKLDPSCESFPGIFLGKTSSQQTHACFVRPGVRIKVGNPSKLKDSTERLVVLVRAEVFRRMRSEPFLTRDLLPYL